MEHAGGGHALLRCGEFTAAEGGDYGPAAEPIDAETRAGHGSEGAATELAARREREPHRLERERGRHAAGEEGNLRDEREPGVTREDLAEAAREADRRVVGHEVEDRTE